jgi:hypothetical protein
MKILEIIDAFIVKHHNCEKNMRMYSITWHEDQFGLRRVIGQEYRCIYCGKSHKWDIDP